MRISQINDLKIKKNWFSNDFQKKGWQFEWTQKI